MATVLYSPRSPFIGNCCFFHVFLPLFEFSPLVYIYKQVLLSIWSQICARRILHSALYDDTIPHSPFIRSPKKEGTFLPIQFITGKSSENIAFYIVLSFVCTVPIRFSCFRPCIPTLANDDARRGRNRRTLPFCIQPNPYHSMGLSGKEFYERVRDTIRTASIQ